MGIDLKSGGRRKGHNVRTAPVTKNVYVKLLEKLYRYAKQKTLDHLLVLGPAHSSLSLPPPQLPRPPRREQIRSNHHKAPAYVAHQQRAHLYFSHGAVHEGQGGQDGCDCGGCDE